VGADAGLVSVEAGYRLRILDETLLRHGLSLASILPGPWGRRAQPLIVKALPARRPGILDQPCRGRRYQR
jgi:hypothetical protein